METCEDCFEDFEPTKDNKTICSKCDPPTKYTIERCAHIWKIFQTRGFNSQEELDEYKVVKKNYKKLRGKDLPQLSEKVGKKK